jgi:hypothetical protein
MLSLMVGKEVTMTPIGLMPNGLSDAKSASLERAKQLEQHCCRNAVKHPARRLETASTR